MEAVKNFFIRRCGKSKTAGPARGNLPEQECPDDKNPGIESPRVLQNRCFLFKRPA